MEKLQNQKVLVANSHYIRRVVTVANLGCDRGHIFYKGARRIVRYQGLSNDWKLKYNLDTD